MCCCGPWTLFDVRRWSIREVCVCVVSFCIVLCDLRHPRETCTALPKGNLVHMYQLAEDKSLCSEQVPRCAYVCIQFNKKKWHFLQKVPSVILNPSIELRPKRSFLIPFYLLPRSPFALPSLSLSLYDRNRLKVQDRISPDVR